MILLSLWNSFLDPIGLQYFSVEYEDMNQTLFLYTYGLNASNLILVEYQPTTLKILLLPL